MARFFYPVIHGVRRQAMVEPHLIAAIDVALRSGADGVFLINQGIRSDTLLALIPEIRELFPGAFIGLNLLGEHPANVIAMCKEANAIVDGLWVDHDDGCYREGISQARALFNFKYFGGVAFKYGPTQDANRQKIGELVDQGSYIDVVTTSGSGTGHAAPLDKVRTFHDALKGRPLGIASGITPENVDGFLPYVTHYLVATGIEKDIGVLDSDRTKTLADKIHACLSG